MSINLTCYFNKEVKSNHFYYEILNFLSIHILNTATKGSLMPDNQHSM